uniref:Uncharacterized protein n=1 Tax=Oryza brachyantha TaxID=4533 RepID=J3MTN8_ORYBR
MSMNKMWVEFVLQIHLKTHSIRSLHPHRRSSSHPATPSRRPHTSSPPPSFPFPSTHASCCQRSFWPHVPASSRGPHLVLHRHVPRPLSHSLTSKSCKCTHGNPYMHIWESLFLCSLIFFLPFNLILIHSLFQILGFFYVFLIEMDAYHK